MSQSTELLPCPFCGNVPSLKKGKTTIVSCSGCTASTFQTVGDKTSAITEWNTRAIASVKREPLIDAKIHSILWDAHPVCCGNLEDDGEWYMGMREPAHCCGCPDHDMLNDPDIVKALRNLIPEQAHGIGEGVAGIPITSQWLPIESAPRTSDEVLVLSVNGGRSIQTGLFVQNMTDTAVNNGEQPLYTHWMPLPALPVTATTTSREDGQ